MSENNYVTLACAHLGVSQSQILSVRETEDSVIMVIDLGIKGCPKYTVSKTEIEPSEPEPQPKKATKRTTTKRGKK